MNCSIDKLHQIYEEVKNSAYAIIEAKGATYYAIAESVRRIVNAIIRDEDTILPVSSLVSGHYGLNDVCLGLPSILGRDGVKRILDIPLDDGELTALHRSAEKMKNIITELTFNEKALV